ncbi:MAG: hypothetical protein QXE51_00280 [Nitrososphaeria archaeon]
MVSEVSLEEKHCLYCGRKFKAIGKQKFCSVRCRKLFYKHNRVYSKMSISLLKRNTDVSLKTLVKFLKRLKRGVVSFDRNAFEVEMFLASYVNAWKKRIPVCHTDKVSEQRKIAKNSLNYLKMFFLFSDDKDVFDDLINNIVELADMRMLIEDDK